MLRTCQLVCPNDSSLASCFCAELCSKENRYAPSPFATWSSYCSKMFTFTCGRPLSVRFNIKAKIISRMSHHERGRPWYASWKFKRTHLCNLSESNSEKLSWIVGCGGCFYVFDSLEWKSWVHVA